MASGGNLPRHLNYIPRKSSNLSIKKSVVNVGGKTRHIAFELALQQCWKFKLLVFVNRFTEALHLNFFLRHYIVISITNGGSLNNYKGDGNYSYFKKLNDNSTRTSHGIFSLVTASLRREIDHFFFIHDVSARRQFFLLVLTDLGYGS